jgi:xanthine dehydrogenase YagS FAD-binding subunit
MNSFALANPRSIDEAIRQAAKGGTYKAGGIDLLDCMKEGLASPPLLVNLSGVPGLDAVATDAKGNLVIGPTVTLAKLSENAVVIARARAVAQSAAHSATPQIRNQATVGGNLLQRPRCWYYRSADFHCRRKGGQTCFAHDGEHEYHAIFDNQLCAMVHPSSLAVALIAMEARLQLTSAKGRREAALESFYLTPEQNLHAGYHLEDAELVTGVIIPPAPAGLVSAFVKVGQKESFDWPLADAAVAMQLQGGKCRRARVILGAAAPVPWRAKHAEAELENHAITVQTANRAAKAATQGATPLSRNAYKMAIFEAVVSRTIIAAAAQDGVHA